MDIKYTFFWNINEIAVKFVYNNQVKKVSPLVCSVIKEYIFFTATVENILIIVYRGICLDDRNITQRNVTSNR